MAEIRNYSKLTIKLLFGNTGNICTNPDCSEEVVSENDVIGQIAHICSFKENNVRFNQDKPKEELNSESNLIVLCPNCHTKIDKRPNEYSVETLISWKKQRLKLLKNKKWFMSPNYEKLIADEFKLFWLDIDNINKNIDFIEVPKYKVKSVKNINQIISIFESNIKRLNYIADILSSDMEKIEDDLLLILENIGADLTKYGKIPYYENPLLHRNWEMLTFGLGNFIIDQKNQYYEILIYLYEKELSLYPENDILKKDIHKLKKLIFKITKNSYYFE